MLKSFPKTFIQDLDRRVLILIFIGSLSWSLVMVKSGLMYDFGMGFWGPNGHDGVWHIAMAEGFSRGTWNMPMFAGETIKNYHIGFDLILAVLHKLTFVPIRILYFQIIPPLLAFGIGVSAYKFVFDWQKSKLAAFWSTFFVYFGGGFGWLLSLIRNRNLDGESMFWSQQSVSTLINPPFALSLLIIFVALNLLQTGTENKDKKKLVISTFLFGILVQIKVYAGLLALFGLLITGLYQAFKNRRINIFKVFAGSVILSLVLLLPVLTQSSSVVFRPFWFLETMMGFSDRVNWPKFADAMVNYRLAGNWIKALIAYSAAFVIFWYGNIGTRIVQEFIMVKWLKKPKKIDPISVFIACIILSGVVIPMFFVQKGTPWNTIQFMYYSLVFSSVFAGVVVGDVDKKLKSNKLLSTFALTSLVLFTIPTTIGTLWFHYLPSRPPAMLSYAELDALKFLSVQPKGVVLTLPFDRDKALEAESNPPRPLYLYESTAYVSAFSGQPTYLEDEVNLEITGFNWKDRRSSVENYLSNHTKTEFLTENNISYLYFVKPLNRHFVYAGAFTRIFTNSEVDIFKLN
jgi:hypothetical protein